MADKEKWKGRAYPHGLARHKKQTKYSEKQIFLHFYKTCEPAGQW